MTKQHHNNKTYYDILKILPDTNDQEVRDAYLTLARIYHPDKNRNKHNIASTRFKMIGEAYSNLQTESKRQHYNRILRLKNAHKTHIKAENDNQKPRNKNRLWDQLFGLFTPVKPAPHSQQPSSNRS
tara:strand:+ start:3197 stop:3577 length:381 start_codon:yes stop_codon:yes gene_type:complete